MMLILSTSKPVFSQISGSINGKVLALNNNEAIPFVNILLINNADSLHPKSFQTDANGVFSIKNLSLSIYKIQFSFIGYQTKAISKITLDDSKSTIDLGNVFLDNDSKMLNEVVIEYKKPIVDMQDDKIV